LSGGSRGSGIDPSPNAGDVAWRDILAVLRRHSLFILLSVALGAGIAAYLAVRATPEYRASAVIRLGDTRRSITQGIEGPEDPAGQTNPLLSQAQLARSRSLIGQVVDSAGLRARVADKRVPQSLLAFAAVDAGAPDYTVSLAFSPREVSIVEGAPPARAAYGDTLSAPGFRFVIASPPKVDRTTITIHSRETTIDWLLSRLRVAPRQETDVVDVSFTHADPVVAQHVVNAVVHAYQAANVSAAQARSRKRRVFLEEQLRVMDAELANAEHNLAAFRTRERVYNSGPRLEAQQTALMTLDMRRHELAADRTMYQTMIQALEQPRAGANSDELRSTLATADLGSNPVVAHLYQQLTQYQSARDSLTTGQWRSAATNPDVGRLDTLIGAAERRLVGAVRGHIASLDARVGALDTLRARSVAAMDAFPRAESTEEQLLRHVEASRTLVDDVRGQYQKARMAEVVEAGQVEIVDPAGRPYQPESRLGLLKLAIGIGFGFVTGVGGAFVRERARGAIRRRGDLETELQLPVLSIIPRMGAPTTRQSFSRLTAMLPIGASADLPAGQLPSPSSADAEAYRLLRTNLHWAPQGVDALKTLVITSAMTREGKSMTSANLAFAFALEGRRTLLVDCDLRRTRLHHVFGVPRNPGLAQLLRGHLPAAAAVRSTFLPGLFFLPSGHLSSLPSDLLGLKQTRAVLDELAGMFDMIILDTPPVLSVADPVILAAQANGVILVVRAGETDREAVHQALRQLDSVGARVLGAVLNDPSGEVKRYGDYYATADYDAVGD
jgi:capsular exopolysaccharide synthesis family protein